MDEREAIELAAKTPLTVLQARAALAAWGMVGATGWQAQELISHLLAVGADPVNAASTAYTLIHHRTPSPIGPLPKRVEVRWPPPGVHLLPDSYWIRDD